MSQFSLFTAEELPPSWRELWQDMPEFIQEDREPVQRITINFASLDDVRRFAELIGQRVTKQTDSLWFPKLDWIAPSNWVYSDES